MAAGGGDDLGPLEIEFMFTFIFLMAGIFGVGAMDKPVNAYFGASWIPDFVIWGGVLGSFFAILLVVFALEPVMVGFRKDFWATFHYFKPIFLIGSIAFLEGYLQTECYKNQYVIFNLIHNFTFDLTCYRLYLSGMIK